MRKLMLGAVAATTLAMTMNIAAPASAQVAGPATAATMKAGTVDLKQDVRWRGRRHWRHRHYRRHHGWGPAVGAGIAGLVIGGALAAQARSYDNSVAYCLRRFKSYDPASGTYLGYDGYRHPCP